MKFSIVTPSYNSRRFISETIESVISQHGDFEIEYIIKDGGSDDGTLDIIRRYEQKIKSSELIHNCNKVMIKLLSGKDNGMYDAINKGFAVATGDIYAWINSDDIYLPGAFNAVVKVFKEHHGIRWLKGITSYITESSTIYDAGRCYLYNQKWIQKGIYGVDAYFIQQDSVFWHAGLWKSIGGIDSSLRLAGDYDLWRKFAEKTCLFTLKAYLSCFRNTEGQLSKDKAAYRLECAKVTGHSGSLDLRIRFYFIIERKIPATLRHLIYILFFGFQSLNLIEVNDNDKLVFKKVHYWVF